MLSALFRCEHFDLSGNPGIDQSTFAGFVGCSLKNAQTRINAVSRGLKGVCVCIHHPACHCKSLPHVVVHVAGTLPKQLPVSLEMLNLSCGSADDSAHSNHFTGGIPREWATLINLKELGLRNCLIGGVCARASVCAWVCVGGLGRSGDRGGLARVCSCAR